jgi:N-acetylmuramoyl-L-alanine amidase
MNRIVITLIVIILIAGGIVVTKREKSHTTNPIESVGADIRDTIIDQAIGDDRPACDLPQSPKRVGLQVGHWKNEEAPEELKSLREKGDGAAHGGIAEWEAMLVIAEQMKPLLEAQGFVVDVLPTTIPESYCADAFVSLHADSSNDTSITGYKGSTSWRDSSGKGAALNTAVETAYAATTGLPYEPTVTRNMRGYYAFNWMKYDHAVHRKTPAIIFETAFLSNSNDRAFLTKQSEKVASGIATGIVNFLTSP